jgi:hypothetical protein
MIGICVTDAWKAYRYAFQKQKKCEELTIKDFADRLAYELINNTFDNIIMGIMLHKWYYHLY